MAKYEGKIRWSRSDYAILGKAVAAFNRKKRELETEENKNYLPDTLNYKDIKQDITTRRQLKEVIKNLKQFKEEDATELYVNQAGQQMTKWEHDILKEYNERGLESLNKQLKNILKTKGIKPYMTEEERTVRRQINNLKKFEFSKRF